VREKAVEEREARKKAARNNDGNVRSDSPRESYTQKDEGKLREERECEELRRRCREGKEEFSRVIIDDEGNVRSDLSDLSDFPMESYAKYLQLAIKFIRSDPNSDSDGKVTLETLELIEKLLEHYDLSYEGVRQDTNEFVKETKCYLRKLDLRKKSWWNDLEKKDGKFKKLFLCYPDQMGLKKQNDGKFEKLSSSSLDQTGLKEQNDGKFEKKKSEEDEKEKSREEEEPIRLTTRQAKKKREKERKDKKRQENLARVKVAEEKAVEEREAREKAAAEEKAAREKAAEEKAAREKAAEEKAARQ